MDFLRSAAGIVDLGGELFQISESLSGDLPLIPFAMIDRAVAIGRDPTELLALRSSRRCAGCYRRHPDRARAGTRGDRDGTVDVAAQSAGDRDRQRCPPIWVTALDPKYREAIDLDANFKNGTIKEREQALSGLLAPYFWTTRAAGPRRGSESIRR